MRQLYITAHPHYPACLCGGTIFNHTRNGDEVFVVSLSAGELMTNRVTPKELTKINREDAEKAGKLLGIKETRILDIPDTEIENTPELRMILNNTIREFKPDVLVTHWPLDTHPDYRNTAQAAIDAAFLALIVSGKWAGDRSSHWTSKAWGFECPALSVNFAPDLFIDITAELETKKEALDCFAIHCESNFDNDYEKYHGSILGPNRHWGTESGVTYAEPYGHIKIHEVHNKARKYLID